MGNLTIRRILPDNSYPYPPPQPLWRLGSGVTPNRVALAFCMRSWMKTNARSTVFNLYYGCLKGTPHRWLDLAGAGKSDITDIDRLRGQGASGIRT